MEKFTRLVHIQNINEHYSDRNISEKECSPLATPKNGAMNPPKCSNHPMELNSICQFSCDKGFQIQGPRKRQCVAPGQWNNERSITKCVGMQQLIINETLVVTLLFILNSLILSFHSFNLKVAHASSL